MWFLMRDRNGVVVFAETTTMLEGWFAADPVDDAERNRHEAFSQEMGWSNPYVARKKRFARLLKFPPLRVSVENCIC